MKVTATSGGAPNGQRGQALILVTLLAFALMGIVAIAIDGASALLWQRFAQNAADASALAGGRLLANNASDNQISQAVLTFAQDNQWTSGAGTLKAVYLDNHNPPDVVGTVGSGMPDNAYGVRVNLSMRFASLFAVVFGDGMVSVSAQAAAAPQNLNKQYALIALSQTAPKAIDIANGTVTVQGGILSDSSNNRSFTQSGGSLTVQGPLDAVGGLNLSGGTLNDQSTEQGAPYVSDPFANVPPPTFGSPGSAAPTPGVYTDTTTSAQYTSPGPATPSVISITGSDNWTIGPGVYYGGLSVTGGSTITFEPGVYVFAGGGLTVNGAITVTGQSVFFYNTNDPISPNGHGGYGPVAIAGNAGGLNLTAPSSPPYPGGVGGMVLFQDRLASASSLGAKFTGGAGPSTLDGTVYIPSNSFTVTGGAAVTVPASQVVAQTVSVSSLGGSLSIAFDPSSSANVYAILLTE